ncbi:MAG TPA: hypothetical protein VF502_02805 [Stellaceae bacterium]
MLDLDGGTNGVDDALELDEGAVGGYESTAIAPSGIIRPPRLGKQS